MELPLELHVGVLLFILGVTTLFVKLLLKKKVVRTDDDKMIRVLSWNAYLVPYFEVKKMPGVMSCQNQDRRANDLGKIAKKKDINLIQEYWGSHCYSFDQHLDSTHTIFNKAWLGAPLFPVFVNEWIDAALLNLIYKTGGLSTSIDNRFRVLYQESYLFDTKAGENFNRNIMGVLIDVSAKWPGKFILACNTHLISHPTTQRSEARLQQLIESQKFISRLLSIARAQHIPLKDVGVIFAGDFNIAAVSTQYEDMKNVYGDGMRDLFHEMYQESHLKEHYTYCSESNSMVMDKEDIGRIDYLLAFDKFLVGDKVEQLLHLDCAEMKILKQEKGNEISDHWGLEADFRPPS